MKGILIAAISLGVAAHAFAQEYESSEDRTRFVEQPYKKAEPGMKTPAEYVAIAKDSIRKAASPDLHLRRFSDPVISHRIYRNAPPADRDIVAVEFVYEGSLSGGGMVSRDFVFNRAVPVPVLQALIRKDGSKVYLNIIHFKQA